MTRTNGWECFHTVIMHEAFIKSHVALVGSFIAQLATVQCFDNWRNDSLVETKHVEPEQAVEFIDK